MSGSKSKSNDSADEQTYVNRQITDAASATAYAVISQAGNEAQAISYEALAHTTALMMQNAGATQFNCKQVSTSAVARTCQEILDLK